MGACTIAESNGRRRGGLGRGKTEKKKCRCDGPLSILVGVKKVEDDGQGGGKRSREPGKESLNP